MTGLLEAKGFSVAVLTSDRVRFDHDDPSSLPGVLEGTISLSIVKTGDGRWLLERHTEDECRRVFVIHGNRTTAVDSVSNWVRDECSGVTA